MAIKFAARRVLRYGHVTCSTCLHRVPPEGDCPSCGESFRKRRTRSPRATFTSEVSRAGTKEELLEILRKHKKIH